MLLRLQNSFASMSATVHQQERIANNLANANTVGYKRARTFTEALNERLDAEQAPQSDRDTRQWVSLEQGPLEKTGNPLDVAIDGEGFFVVSDPATGDLRFTRAGRFALDEEGLLRDPQGFQVEGATGPLQLPPNAAEIKIDQAGEVTVDGQVVGQLRIATFEDPMQLRPIDGVAFDAGGMEPEDVEHPRLVQGHVEQSNVDSIHEMTEMIEHFRLFESQSKLLQSNDQVLGSITRDLGRF